MTRQARRYAERRAAASDASQDKRRAREEGRRALLRRQSAREKADFYTGLSVGKVRQPSRSRIDSRKVQKAQPFGRILKSFTEDGRERSLHATKGWRNTRA